MEAQQAAEGVPQCKSCRGAEGDGGIWAARTAEGQDKLTHKCSNCQVLKSGPLLISSKGIGWTSWKKRWFILTRTSLTFFRSDPSVSAQKGTEANLTLGGIELNNSGSVVVKADKKLLTVLFPDGRDGRTFTLKAETSEDLQEWKTALENALAQAPNAALVLGQNSLLRNDSVDTIENAVEQGKDDEPIKSTIIGRPALLALEDVDGKPSFLEKALRFIEQHGIKTEGILRQSADVEEVKHRFEEYEQGKNEFSVNEDAHVIADCIKYVLREMPSSPVPAACCTALLEAFKRDRAARVSRMSTVIYETFPEPNRRLLSRVLEMMRIIVSHKSENLMSVSAVAACMAPLLLRPLLAGDCEMDDDFNMGGGDGSLQLLQAAAAANHAQAMIITLLEEYDNIFTEDYIQEDSSSEVYSDSEDAYGEDEEDDDDYEYEDSTENEAGDDDGCHHSQKDATDAESEDDHGQTSSGSSATSEIDVDLHHKEGNGGNSDTSPLNVEMDKKHENVESDQQLPKNKTMILKNSSCKYDELLEQSKNSSVTEVYAPNESPDSVTGSEPLSTKNITSSGPASSIKRRTVWGRTAAKKNLSTESIEYASEEEVAIHKLDDTKADMQNKLTVEVEENERLQASLDKQKHVLRERHMALQRDVEENERLQASLDRQKQVLREQRLALQRDVEENERLQASLDKEEQVLRERRTALQQDVVLLEAPSRSNLNESPKELQSSTNNRNTNSSEEIPSTKAKATSKKAVKGEIASSAPKSVDEKAKLQGSKSQLSRDPPPKQPTSQNDIKPTGVTSSPLTEGSSSMEAKNLPQTCSKGEIGTTTKCDGNSIQHKESGSTSTEGSCISREMSISDNSKKKENIPTGATSRGSKPQALDSAADQAQGPQHQNQAEKAAIQDSGKVVAPNSSSNEKVSLPRPDALPQELNNPKLGTSFDSVKTQQIPGSPPLRRRQPTRKPTSRMGGNPTTLASVVACASALQAEDSVAGAGSTSKKSATPVDLMEAASSSALSKLTNRLNFLKERRMQLANELQAMDLGRVSNSEGHAPKTSHR